jgi:hypothetical protein
VFGIPAWAQFGITPQTALRPAAADVIPRLLERGRGEPGHVRPLPKQTAPARILQFLDPARSA